MKKLHLLVLLIYSFTLQSSSENNEQHLQRNEELFYYATHRQEDVEKVLLVNFSLFSEEKFTNLRRELQDRNKSFAYRGYDVHVMVNKKTKPLLVRGQILAFIQYEIDKNIANAALLDDDDKTRIINHINAQQRSSNNMFHEKFKSIEAKKKSGN